MYRQQRRMGFFITFIGLAVLVGCVLIASYRTGGDENIRLGFQEREELAEGWSVQGVGENYPIVSFPYKTGSKVARFYYQVPEQAGRDDVLILENRYQKLRVSIGGKEIYGYGMGVDNGYFMPANLYCYIDILPEYAGKEIEVFVSTWGMGNEAILYRPVLSTKGMAVIDMLRENMVAGIFSLTAGAMSFVLLGMALVWMFKASVRKAAVFGSLGLFMLLSAVWVLTDSRLLQLFVNNSQIILSLSFEVFLLLPVPLIWFVDILFNYEGKAFRILRFVFILNCLLQNLLYISKISNFIYLVWVTHAIIVISIIYIVYRMLRASISYHSFYARGILLGIGMFACISGISILTFYHSRGVDNERFFILGFALLVIELLLLSVKKLQEFGEDESDDIFIPENKCTSENQIG